MQISEYLTVGTGILAVSIYIITFFIKRVVETAWPALKKQADENSPKVTYPSQIARWWSKVILPAVPVAIGVALGAFHVPYLFDAPGLEQGAASMFFGGVIGWFATMLYKGVRLAIKAKTGVDIGPEESIPPAPDKEPQDREPLG
jgi:fucose permease